mmetsp:Transcript_42442/g.136065  ORF Transcript_42442/g.136065 Transcript_42442/m.136065 type:complete len:250 (-) Transcript_42442:467-1216(-)
MQALPTTTWQPCTGRSPFSVRRTALSRRGHLCVPVLEQARTWRSGPCKPSSSRTRRASARCSTTSTATRTASWTARSSAGSARTSCRTCPPRTCDTSRRCWTPTGTAKSPTTRSSGPSRMPWQRAMLPATAARPPRLEGLTYSAAFASTWWIPGHRPARSSPSSIRMATGSWRIPSCGGSSRGWSLTFGSTRCATCSRSCASSTSTATGASASPSFSTPCAWGASGGAPPAVVPALFLQLRSGGAWRRA